MPMIEEVHNLRDSQLVMTSEIAVLPTEVPRSASNTVTHTKKDQSSHEVATNPPRLHYDNICALRQMTNTKLFLSQRYFQHLIEQLQILRDSEVQLTLSIAEIKSQITGRVPWIGRSDGDEHTENI